MSQVTVDLDRIDRSILHELQLDAKLPFAALAELVKHNPQSRLIQPAEIAEAVVWLCRPESASVTGQSIAVAGGEVM